MDFYRTEKEGQDRIENLEELVNAAESFVTQEGFGKDAVALPVDEQRAAAGAAGRWTCPMPTPARSCRRWRPS
jgi:DNA helicase-2/ATP-dependent DNA helicase PcrA